MTTINEYIKEVHDDAIRKGWWNEKEKSPLECHMLMVSEISEATEAVRDGKDDHYLENGKPEGESVELADCIIRIFDYAGHKGWNLDKIIREKIDFNKGREHRHGNKRY